MMKKSLLVFMLFAPQLWSCKTENEVMHDESYEVFIEAKEKNNEYTANSYARLVAEYHYDNKKKEEAQDWLNKYRADSTRNALIVNEEYKKEDDRFSSLGELVTLDIDKHRTKCNLTRGSYYFKSNKLDSADLAFAVEYLAGYLFRSMEKKAGCSYPAMSSAHIYLNKTDFTNDNSPLATCNITPDNYAGKVYIDMYKLNKKK